MAAKLAELKLLAEQTVLCWLASTDEEGFPNLSPKEIFVITDEEILIANIASAQSERNIYANERVCLSFVEIYKQKGFKVKARAKVLGPQDANYSDKLALLRQKAPERFPIKSIFKLEMTRLEPIVAPSYWLFGATEVQQIEGAEKQYEAKLEQVKAEQGGMAYDH
ncbi:MAG: pyridoxamine 5'-phosphate oxidase family protein [Trueperaceae bacterium]|nr:pyridoxamine 5'-phosphate oxidase family protein [Trueperaceae bacterium]